jgi:hypothetical protein
MTLNETKIGSKVSHPTRGTGIVTGISGSTLDSGSPLCAQVTIGEVSHLFPLEVLRPA